MGKPLKIIFYGPPGSGKDTHSQILAKELGLPVFSIGEMLRGEISRKTKIGLEIQGYVMRGEIAPESIIFELVQRELSRDIYRNGYIGSGFKTLDFTKFYLSCEVPTHVIYLVLPDDLIHARLMNRAREDDSPEVIETRLRLYRGHEILTREFWRDRSDVPCSDISNDGPIEEVSQCILDFVKQ